MSKPSLFHRKSDDVRMVKIFKDAMPEKTDVWCWWCCHPFDSLPLAIPLQYDNITDKFLLMGVFCSFSCCKAYTLHSNIYNKPIITSNIKIMAKRMGINYNEKIIPSPPRQMLKVFGGNLTIEDFRNMPERKIAINILNSNQIISSQFFEEKDCGIVNIGESGSLYKNREERNKEIYALKRTKPLKKNKGTLEAAMGITIK